MSYTKEDFLENDDYWNSGDDERIQSITLSKELNTPPSEFSKEAKEAWIIEKNTSLEMLAGSHAFMPYIPENGGILHGPFDVLIDYDKEERSYVFHITSLMQDRTEIYRLQSRQINRLANSYREQFMSTDFERAMRNANTPSVRIQMNDMRSLNHGKAAKSLMDSFKDADISCRELGFAKDLFTLLQIVAPMHRNIAAKMSEAYEYMGYS